ncbi:hypothetical protein [Bradyrhizobium japonicum]|uniref:hypothetical protein n=1 Tax=Bradyrhizobium japonicum TaxID=375 RepID=UPI00130E31BE|nr:hypothetical protein [Bradyrhizobium japonicum]MCD9106358.1 hypothetical protein [Bradyrhizobium japonicum]MCD9252797.1 hypothetical protein [Bradyrhizobium japonicum SEMIA 5079]MCD9905095.1 hypothetical protein [Bradyrhizobium japonicum]MCS3984402.1 hypothetical protein [Bradyrhizobium japonicum]WRI73643.1 hypothetical protein RZE83_10740 [Bradyrhizobium japonicum]
MIAAVERGELLPVEQDGVTLVVVDEADDAELVRNRGYARIIREAPGPMATVAGPITPRATVSAARQARSSRAATADVCLPVMMRHRGLAPPPFDLLILVATMHAKLS